MRRHLRPDLRHDLLFLFDVQDGNPNGDPDAGNLPRMDIETGHGLVSNGSLKRRIRDYVALTRDATEPENAAFKIYVEGGEPLNDKHRRAYLEAAPDEEISDPKGRAPDAVRSFMLANYWDIRMFGAVLSTSVNAGGKVQGPVQLTDARSYDPVTPMDFTITRGAAPNNPVGHGAGNSQIIRRSIIPYALYRSYGFISGSLAAKAGVTEDDLELLYDGMLLGFDSDRASLRGFMTARAIVVFTHDSPVGRAPASTLFERLTVRTRSGRPPRAFSDYEVSLDEERLPRGVTVRVLGPGF